VPSVSEFVQNDAEATVKIGKAPHQVDIVVRYRPNEITTSRIQQMSERESNGDMLAFLKLFEETVIEWDVEGPLFGEVVVMNGTGPQKDDDGQDVYERRLLVAENANVPIDPEILKFLPQTTIAQIWRGLVEDQAQPDPQTQRGSRRR